jgi:hypothetical protein
MHNYHKLTQRYILKFWLKCVIFFIATNDTVRTESNHPEQLDICIIFITITRKLPPYGAFIQSYEFPDNCYPDSSSWLTQVFTLEQWFLCRVVSRDVAWEIWSNPFCVSPVALCRATRSNTKIAVRVNRIFTTRWTCTRTGSLTSSSTSTSWTHSS